jgi:hypothetical protein
VPNTDLALEQLTEEVQSMLGKSSVEVELALDDMKVLAKRALRMFNRYLPYRGRFELIVTTAQKKYRIDNHAGLTGLTLKGVTSVDFIQRDTEPSTPDVFDPFYGAAGPGVVGDSTYADIMQQRMYMEDASRIVSTENEWHCQWERIALSPGPGWENQYFLYIDALRGNTRAGVFFIAEYPDTDEGRTMLPNAEVDLFVNWCLAEAKEILGRARGKFGGVPNPEGSNDETDWSQLLQESTTDKEKLEAEFRARKRPYLPVIE